MNAINYRLLRAFSAQYGTVVGLLWILSFSCYILGLRQALIGNLGLLLGLGSVIVAGYLVRRFRHQVYDLKFGQSWWMAVLMFMYAALLMAVAQFIYFQYIDQGMLAEAYSEILQLPETQELLKNMMPGQDIHAAAQQTIDLLNTISPIALTFEFLIYNLFLGIFLALPAAWIGISGKKQP